MDCDRRCSRPCAISWAAPVPRHAARPDLTPRVAASRGVAGWKQAIEQQRHRVIKRREGSGGAGELRDIAAFARR